MATSRADSQLSKSLRGRVYPNQWLAPVRKGYQRARSQIRWRGGTSARVFNAAIASLEGCTAEAWPLPETGAIAALVS
jgi:hypothetical protein